MKEVVDKQRWRAEYRATAEALERLRAIELAAMTEEGGLRRMALLTVCEVPWRERREWSGLVEQQAYFERGRAAIARVKEGLKE